MPKVNHRRGFRANAENRKLYPRSVVDQWNRGKLVKVLDRFDPDLDAPVLPIDRHVNGFDPHCPYCAAGV